MLINVYAEPKRARPFPGTRILQENLGLIGLDLVDPKEPGRVWWIQSCFSPIPGKKPGGIRAKLVDSKGFVTFCNQRDLEVLIGVAKPGDWCGWTGSEYADPDDNEWFGLCADDLDLEDDLQERELQLRAQVAEGILLSPLEMNRRVHLEPRMDFEELHVLVWDYDPETGLHPDPRLSTISKRWVRSHRERIRWERI